MLVSNDGNVGCETAPANRLKGTVFRPSLKGTVFRPSRLREQEVVGDGNAARDTRQHYEHTPAWSTVASPASRSDQQSSSTAKTGAADPDKWERKLFLTNLPDGCTEEKLNNYFSKYCPGEVEDVWLVRGRGGRRAAHSRQEGPAGERHRKAHVLFYDPEAMEIAAQNTHFIDDQEIIALPALPPLEKPLNPKKRVRGNTEPKPEVDPPEVLERKILVSSLPQSCTSEQLFDYFSTAVAPVEDAVVMFDEPTATSREWGFVLFEDRSGKHLAMQTFIDGWLGIDGKRLSIRNWGPTQSDTKGWVTGIALSCTEADLYNAFGQYGEIEKVDMKKQGGTREASGSVVVTFAHSAALDKALADKCNLVRSYSHAFSKTTRIKRAEVSTSKREKQRRKAARRVLRRAHEESHGTSLHGQMARQPQLGPPVEFGCEDQDESETWREDSEHSGYASE